jgi:hypothetical protein
MLREACCSCSPVRVISSSAALVGSKSRNVTLYLSRWATSIAMAWSPAGVADGDDKGDIAAPRVCAPHLEAQITPDVERLCRQLGPARDRFTSHLRCSSLVSLGQGHWGKMGA